MNTLSVRSIASGTDDDLFKLLCAELAERLPDRDSPEFISDLRKLPRGLRAMAATYELDVSLALDDLGWHFGNWHDEELALETLDGLRELGATEFAELFASALVHAKGFWVELGSAGWMDWYHGSELEAAVMPLNDRAWNLWKERPMGLFSYWVEYARRAPENVGARHDA
jgi:hypothetical protein